MANSINLVDEMLPLIDEVYKKEAKSTVLDAAPELVQATADAHTFKIAKMALVGLGNYNKATGYPEGDVTLTWETKTFSNDRGRRFSVDRMDNMESFGLTASRLVGEYLRTEVIPEIDAYRFAKIATAAGKKVEGTLTGADTKAAVDAGIVTLQENEVDDGRMIIFMTPTVAQSLSDNIIRMSLNGENGINNVIETYNGIQIIRVPQTRFYTQITLNAGGSSSVGGYTKTGSSGAEINFIVMDKNAAFNITKLNASKLFTPDENQLKDAYQFDFRAYHDSFVADNKAAGIYLHAKAAA